MTKTVHTFYVGTMVFIIIIVSIYLFYTGYSYYATAIEERFYHPNHHWFKPSGAFGHGLGIIGTLMILFGVSIYILRKRYNFLSKLLRLKYLLEFHIFLCTLGPILVLFHTAFKFGGIVSIAFWSMVAVVLSGVIGRFIYIQIPRSIEGRELTLNEVKIIKAQVTSSVMNSVHLDEETTQLISTTFTVEDQGLKEGAVPTKQKLSLIKRKLKQKNIPRKERARILKMIKSEMSLAKKISRLQMMQRLFKYWHVAHLPFALIMLIVVVLHVGITLAFGSKWIF